MAGWANPQFKMRERHTLKDRQFAVFTAKLIAPHDATRALI